METTETTTTDVAKLTNEQFIENGLAQFDVTKESLIELVDKYKDLKIDGIDDRAGLKIVHDARMDLVKSRTNISKRGKTIRELATKFNKAVIEREKELINITEPTEEHLGELEDNIIKERERLKEEAEKREADRIQGMINQLAAYGSAMDYHEIISVNDEQFQELLADAKLIWHKEQALAEEEKERKMEEERLAALARQEETERLETQRKEQEERQRLLDEQMANFRADQERIIAEQKSKEDEIIRQAAEIQKFKEDVRRKKLLDAGLTFDGSAFVFKAPLTKQNVFMPWADIAVFNDTEFEGRLSVASVIINQETIAQRAEEEKLRIENTRSGRMKILKTLGVETFTGADLGTMTEEHFHSVEKGFREAYNEKVRIQAEENARIAAEEKVKKDAEAKAEQDRIAKEAEQEAKNSMSDSQKLVSFADEVDDLLAKLPEFKSKKAKALGVEFKIVLEGVITKCRQ